MLGAIVFVAQSENACSQVDFDSEYKHVGSLCSFSCLGICRQNCVNCDNQTDKFDVSATQMKTIILKYTQANIYIYIYIYIFVFICLKERNEKFSTK